jgi:predicted dehydrogenase
MIHDIDLVHWIARSEIASVNAKQRSGPGGASDEVEAEAILSNGCRATLLASRNAAERRRSFRAIYPDGEVSIDFLTRQIVNTTPRALTPLVTDGQPAHPDLADSVGGGVRRFVSAVLGTGAALVSPQEARAALASTLKILSAAQNV